MRLRRRRIQTQTEQALDAAASSHDSMWSFLEQEKSVEGRGMNMSLNTVGSSQKVPSTFGRTKESTISSSDKLERVSVLGTTSK